MSGQRQRPIELASTTAAMNPAKPMEHGPRGTTVGVYWSRALAVAIPVGLAPVCGWQGEESIVPRSFGACYRPE